MSTRYALLHLRLQQLGFTSYTYGMGVTSVAYRSGASNDLLFYVPNREQAEPVFNLMPQTFIGAEIFVIAGVVPHIVFSVDQMRDICNALVEIAQRVGVTASRSAIAVSMYSELHDANLSYMDLLQLVAASRLPYALLRDMVKSGMAMAEILRLNDLHPSLLGNLLPN